MTDDRMKRLTDDLRRWAHRPTRLSPAAARTRVLAELSSRRRRPSWRLLTASATAAAGALALALLVARPPQPVDDPQQVPTATAAERTIVHHLSSGTKLYIVVRPAVGADEC